MHNRCDQVNSETDKKRFDERPYIGQYSEQIQRKCQKFVWQKLSFKFNSYFSARIKHPVYFCFFFFYIETSMQRTALGPEKTVCYIEVTVINKFENFNINFNSRHSILTILKKRTIHQ